jgi:hypothetical protein
VVDVVEKEVERGDALHQPAFDGFPLGCGDDARQQVVGEDAFGAARVAVDGEGDALVQKREVGSLLARLQFRWRQLEQAPVEKLVLRPRRAVGREHLVVGVVQLIGGEGGGLRRRRSFVLAHGWSPVQAVDSVREIVTGVRGIAQRCGGQGDITCKVYNGGLCILPRLCGICVGRTSSWRREPRPPHSAQFLRSGDISHAVPRTLSAGDSFDLRWCEPIVSSLGAAHTADWGGFFVATVVLKCAMMML